MFRRHCEGENIYLIRKNITVAKKGPKWPKKSKKKVKSAKNRGEKNSPKFVKKFLSFELRPSERVKYANFFVPACHATPPRKSFSKVSIVKNTKYFRNFRVLKIFFGDLGHVTTSAVFPILSSFIKSDQKELVFKV